MDKAIIDEVLKLSFDDKAIKALIKPRKENDHRRAIKSLQNQKSKLIDLYRVGGIDMENLTLKINSITDRINILQQDKSTPPELTFEDAKTIFRDAKLIFNEESSTEQKRAILQALIKKIVLNGDAIEIYWRFE